MEKKPTMTKWKESRPQKRAAVGTQMTLNRAEKVRMTPIRTAVAQMRTAIWTKTRRMNTRWPLRWKSSDFSTSMSKSCQKKSSIRIFLKSNSICLSKS
jgi:hypothetical protein